MYSVNIGQRGRMLFVALMIVSGMMVGLGAQRASAEPPVSPPIVEPDFLCVKVGAGFVSYQPGGCAPGFVSVDMTAGPVDVCVSYSTHRFYKNLYGAGCPAGHFPTMIGEGTGYLGCASMYTKVVSWRYSINQPCIGTWLGDVDTGPTPPVVESGYSNLTEAAGTRYKGDNSGDEIYLGVPDLGVGGNRVDTEYPPSGLWQAGTYDLSFAFDQAENKITTAIDGPGGPAALEYDFDLLLAPNCAVGNWDTMDIAVVDRDAVNNIRFNNVMLGGFDLGDFGAEGWNNWTVTEFDFTQSWELTGDLVVANAFLNNETNKLQLTVGCLP